MQLVTSLVTSMLIVMLHLESSFGKKGKQIKEKNRLKHHHILTNLQKGKFSQLKRREIFLPFLRVYSWLLLFTCSLTRAKLIIEDPSNKALTHQQCNFF